MLGRSRTTEPRNRSSGLHVSSSIVVSSTLARCVSTSSGAATRPHERRLVGIAADWGLEKCLRVHGVLTKAETFAILVQSDLLLLLAEGWPLQIPAYLRAGPPILALAPSAGAIAALLDTTSGGWVVDPFNESGIQSALSEAYRGWKQGRPARPDPTVVARFDRAGLVGQLATVLSRIAPAQ